MQKPKSQILIPSKTMGAFISIPDEVLITHVTKGLIGTWTQKKEELYAVRATCKSGLDLARLIRAVDMLRLVTGCPKLEELSWTIHDELHEGAELDEAPLKAIEELLESRGGNTACYAIGEWNEDELDPDCIFD